MRRVATIRMLGPPLSATARQPLCYARRRLVKLPALMQTLPAADRDASQAHAARLGSQRQARDCHGLRHSCRSSWFYVRGSSTTVPDLVSRSSSESGQSAGIAPTLLAGRCPSRPWCSNSQAGQHRDLAHAFDMRLVDTSTSTQMLSTVGPSSPCSRLGCSSGPAMSSPG